VPPHATNRQTIDKRSMTGRFILIGRYSRPGGLH